MIGQTISHYRIVEKLGGGGMGVVYKAEDLKLHRYVALKFLPEGVAAGSTALRRFEREAHAASALNHPNICTIYEVEEHNHQPVIVMEVLDGESLKERIRKGPISTDELLEVGIQSSAALEAAHAKGIIHRDIKPGNIFIVGGGWVKILDFGLAKVSPSHLPENGIDEESLTVEGVIPGTTAYMSPEQVRGEEIDARSDLFSLGVVLYEMATGKRPFAGKNRVLLMNAILNAKPAGPSRVNQALPPSLDTIIARSLEKDRAMRYQHAADFCSDLKRLKHERESGQAAVATAMPAAQRKGRLAGWKLALFAGIMVVTIAAATLFYSHRTKELTEKDTIVLADFANSTGDAIFDDTLKTALSVSLRQSPFLTVLSDSEVTKTLQEMTRPAGTKLTPEVARELCQRAGSKAYLAGSIGSLGSQYVLGLKAVNCRSGDTLAEEQVTAASKEKVLDMLGQAASKLRGELGESLATVQKLDVPLAAATTSSLEALQAYSLGMKARNEKGYAAALPYHQRAIQLDPNFAIGYLAVGGDYFSLGELGRASENYTTAFQLREHASEQEKLEIATAYYLTVTGELDKAAQTFQEFIESYPLRAGAYVSLGNVYSAQGQYEKAAGVTRQGLRLAPHLLAPYANLTGYALALQRFDEARQLIHEAQARRLDDFTLRNSIYALAFLGADSPAMAEQQQWFAGKPDYENFGLALASDTEAYAGHLGKAWELTKRAVESAIRADTKETGAVWQANAALEQAAYGNPVEARQLAAEALKLAPATQGVEAEAGLAFAMAGDTGRAESLTQDLGKRYPLDMQTQSLWLPAIQAQLALNKKNPAAALNTLQAASAIELGEIQFVTNISCLYHVSVRGEAYLAAGQGSAAAAEFQKILDHSGIVWNCWTGALAHLGVARANALQSRTSQGADADAARTRALAAYKDFLTLWKDADPDIPILKEAKAEYARLQ